MTTPEEVFRALIAGISHQAWEEVTALYAEDAVVEHPNAAPGAAVPRWLHGRGQLREHILSVGRDGGFAVQARNVKVHKTGDPEVVIGEFEYHGTLTRSPEPFVIPNIFVMRVRDGLIVESRDYQGSPRPQEPV